MHNTKDKYQEMKMQFEKKKNTYKNVTHQRKQSTENDKLSKAANIFKWPLNTSICVDFYYQYKTIIHVANDTKTKAHNKRDIVFSYI